MSKKNNPWAAKRVVRSWTVRLYAISMRTPLLTFSFMYACPSILYDFVPLSSLAKSPCSFIGSRPRDTTSRHYHAALLPFERLATTRPLVLPLLSRCCRRPSSKERSIGSSINQRPPAFIFSPRPVTQTYRCKAGKLGKDTAA